MRAKTLSLRRWPSPKRHTQSANFTRIESWGLRAGQSHLCNARSVILYHLPNRAFRDVNAFNHYEASKLVSSPK